jgi:hypothetical protein
MIVKTDRKDARGMAHLLRMGWFRPVHVKTMDAREQRTMLSARATLMAQLKVRFMLLTAAASDLKLFLPYAPCCGASGVGGFSRAGSPAEQC